MKTRRRVYAYVTHGSRLLVFAQPRSPEAGIQVPAGTIEHGEDPADAALREAREETGLTGLKLVSFLGQDTRDMRDCGVEELQNRWFYHILHDRLPPERWSHGEFDSEGHIRHPFDFFWAALPDGIPELVADYDEMIPELMKSLQQEATKRVQTMRRIVIIGNSGSGKSFLARELGKVIDVDVVHLDAMFWEPGSFDQKRPTDLVLAEIAGKKQKPGWIVEGVFGELAAQFLDRTDLLIWLDLPWEVCRAGLLARGSESAQHLDPAKAEESFGRLLQWAGEYWKRDNERSHPGHARLFRDFSGEKLHFDCRPAVDEFIRTVRTRPEN